MYVQYAVEDSQQWCSSGVENGQESILEHKWTIEFPASSTLNSVNCIPLNNNCSTNIQNMLHLFWHC
jgi:hypothetical protein